MLHQQYFFVYWCTSFHNNGLFILFQVPLQTPCPSRNLLTIQWHPSKKRSTQLTNGAQSMENKLTPTRGWSVRSRVTPGRWRTWVSVPTRNTWSLAAKVNTVCKFPLSYTGSPLDVIIYSSINQIMFDKKLKVPI